MRDFFQNFLNFLQGDKLKSVTAKNLSLRRNPNLASTFNIELYLAQHCDKIKIQGVATEVTKLLDLKKIKITAQNDGLSPISAFL